jgi:predicted TIM-barrel fold metal-dependent hydrolase
MDRKIAIEEHFALPETLDNSEPYAPTGSWAQLQQRLLDLADDRLSEMDRNGIELSILSLNAPAIQSITDVGRAVQTARRANDVLAATVATHPDRFAGFAAVAMQDPEAAIIELTRCVREFGFKGVLVNGFSQLGDPDSAIYYDAAAYLPFWAAVEQLDVPFYLHPRDPLPSREPIYAGHPWFLGPAWAFGVETSIHALRLMGSGLFDRHPRLTIILGHLGEGLPHLVWRLDHRMAKAPRGIVARRTMTDYLRSNFYVTTSGHFRTPALINAMAEIGPDRVLFSVDYPFEDTIDAAKWFDAAAISDQDRLKIGRLNAQALLGIR